MAKRGKTARPAVRKPKNPTADPVMQALVAKVATLFAERCAVYGIPPDPDGKDFWRLMTYSFVLEHLVAEQKPPASSKKTKPVRWTDEERRRLLERFREAMAGGKRAGGKTVTGAAEILARSKRVSGSPENLIARYYEARSWQRDKITEALLSQSETPRPGKRAKANKKSPAKSTNS
jgi:hypothetical protein